MPQMSPINWLSLFFIFSISLIMFNIMNYYSFMTNSTIYKTSLNKIYLFHNPWKW